MPEETDKEVARDAAIEVAKAIGRECWETAEELVAGLRRFFELRHRCADARTALREVTLASQERRTPDA